MAIRGVSIPSGYRSGSVAANVTHKPVYPTTGSIMGRQQSMLRIGPELFEGIENYIRWAQHVPGQMVKGMDILVRFMALVDLGYSQKYSLGPLDPLQNRPELAWKLPVRRISGRYFFGWKVRRKSLGVWQVYNDSREAFYIEFGIHRNPATGIVSARRIRRPIQKLALMNTLKFMQQTHSYDRVWASIYMPPPGMRTGKGFTWRMQSPATMASTPLERNVMHRLV